MSRARSLLTAATRLRVRHDQSGFLHPELLNSLLLSQFTDKCPPLQKLLSSSTPKVPPTGRKYRFIWRS